MVLLPWKQTFCRHLAAAVVSLFSVLSAAPAYAASQLYSRGYTVMPEPQTVTLSGKDVRFGPHLTLDLSDDVPPNDVAVESLKQGLQSRFRLAVTEAKEESGQGSVIRLTITPNSVAVGSAADHDLKPLAGQSYKIEVAVNSVHITANAAAGLFYGVQTLLQLVKSEGGFLWLPEGQIVDWPDVQLRTIYWDDAHHLERFDELQRVIRQAAFFKVNGIIIKLDGHFQYSTAPAVVEPYALTPGELQELTDYGRRYHVQIIPYLDGPAHIAFILKHPEYAKLRAFPGNNYEICTTNPDSYKLLFGMYSELLAANKGAEYFFLSTDEPYYVGLADNFQCNEAARARQLGSRGKLLAEFITRTADFLHDRGRHVIFWLSEPLEPADLASLPGHLINGEGYDPPLTLLLKPLGIRQMIYAVTQGLESLFPNYYILPVSKRLHPPDKLRTERVQEEFEETAFEPERSRTDLVGSVNAAWADLGLHTETFWLGYSTAAAMAWHPGLPNPNELMESFYRIFYGPSATGMGRVYQLMSLEAQFWSDSWDTVSSTARKPVFSNCSEPRCGVDSHSADDQTVPLPPLPSPNDLSIDGTWAQANERRVNLAAEFSIYNDELLSLLYADLGRADFNRYNLEVFITVAHIYQQNLQMIRGFADIYSFLQAAQSAASKHQPEEAVAAIDRAMDIAQQIRVQRNRALHDVVATWYRSWYPRVPEANGRRFLHELDDVKDHLPDRTINMKYLIYRELLLPFGEWVSNLQSARDQYARKNNLRPRAREFDWADTETLTVQE